MNQYLKYLSGKFNKGKEKIYIFFTGQGLIILSCLSLIFLICMIYGNSMAYLGLFLFFTTLSLSAIQTNENLRGVSLDLSQDKMGGYSPLSLPFLLVSKSSNNAFMLNIEGKNIKGTTHRLIPSSTVKMESSFSAPVGVYPVGDIHLTTTFPFGLFESWKKFNFNKKIYIFPEPKNHKGEYKPGMYSQNRAEYPHGEFLTYGKLNQDYSSKNIDWKKYAQWDILVSKKYDEPHILEVEIKDEDLKGLNHIEKMEQIQYWAQCFNIIKLNIKELSACKIELHSELERFLINYMDRYFET